MILANVAREVIFRVAFPSPGDHVPEEIEVFAIFRFVDFDEYRWGFIISWFEMLKSW